MRRRCAIAVLGGAVALWPAVLRAQQPVPVVGFIRNASFDGTAPLVAAFREGLREMGFVEGQNVAIEFRSAEGHNDRLPSVAAELVRRPVSVVVGNPVSVLAVKALTTTIPIVFASGGDPVRDGLVESLSRPGGNVTGVTFLNSLLSAKQLELLRELMPGVRTVAFLLDATITSARTVAADANAAADALGMRLVTAEASSAPEIDAAFIQFAERRVAALLVSGAAFFLSRHEQIVALAARHALPTIYENRAYVAAGGLMSYSGSITEGYRQAGIYVGRILSGAVPADLPVVLGTRLQLVINLQTARALGVTILQSILARAVEVFV
jgi:putative ABC transport system substrate-binding protein